MTRALWLALLLILSTPTWSLAAVQNCTLAWNARTEADLQGYRVSWGTSSGVYSTTVDVGNVTTRTCAQLGITSAGTYFAAIKAYDTSNNV